MCSEIKWEIEAWKKRTGKRIQAGISVPQLVELQGER